MVRKQTADLGQAPLGPLLLKLSLPGVAGMFLIAFYSIIDTFWVARLGSEAVAALTVAFPLQMIAGALGIGTGIGVASVVSRRFGANHLDEVNDVAGHAVTVPLLTGAVLTTLAVLLPEPLLRAFGATPEILGLGRQYLVAVAWGFPFVMFAQTSNGLYRGAGNAAFPLAVVATSALVNTVLDPFLIFGIGPFPRLETTGAGVATALAQMLAAGLSAWYLWSRHSGYQVRLRHFRLRLRLFAELFHVGGPAFLMHVGQSLVVAVFNWILGSFSPVAIAAYGVSFRVLMLIMPLVIGTSQGLLPIVGYSFGAKLYGRLWGAVKLAGGVAGLTGLVLGGLCWIFAREIADAFTKDPELGPLTVLALRFLLLALWLAAPQMVAVSALQGMGMGPQALLLVMTRQMFVLIPAALLLSRAYGVAGAFAAFPLADTLSAAVTAAYMVRVYRRLGPPRASPEAAEPG